MGRPRRKIDVCSDPRGFTLLEVMVATGLGLFVIVAVAAIFQQMESGQRKLAARSEVKAQGELFSQSMLKLFRTRLATREDKGFQVSSCAEPGAKASCFDIYRHRSAGQGVARYRIKNICQVLSAEALALLKSQDLNLDALATSVESLCGFRCRPGSRPMVLQRFWPNAEAAASRDDLWPRGRIGSATALAAGFCATRRSESELVLLQAFGFQSPGLRRLTLIKRDLILPLDDDPSAVDWLP